MRKSRVVTVGEDRAAGHCARGRRRRSGRRGSRRRLVWGSSAAGIARPAAACHRPRLRHPPRQDGKSPGVVRRASGGYDASLFESYDVRKPRRVVLGRVPEDVTTSSLLRLRGHRSALLANSLGGVCSNWVASLPTCRRPLWAKPRLQRHRRDELRGLYVIRRSPQAVDPRLRQFTLRARLRRRRRPLPFQRRSGCLSSGVPDRSRRIGPTDRRRRTHDGQGRAEVAELVSGRHAARVRTNRARSVRLAGLERRRLRHGTLRSGARQGGGEREARSQASRHGSIGRGKVDWCSRDLYPTGATETSSSRGSMGGEERLLASGSSPRWSTRRLEDRLHAGSRGVHCKRGPETGSSESQRAPRRRGHRTACGSPLRPPRASRSSTSTGRPPALPPCPASPRISTGHRTVHESCSPNTTTSRSDGTSTSHGSTVRLSCARSPASFAGEP